MFQIDLSLAAGDASFILGHRARVGDLSRR